MLAIICGPEQRTDIHLITASFISTSPDQTEIPLAKKRERRDSCQSIMLDKEQFTLIEWSSWSWPLTAESYNINSPHIGLQMIPILHRK